jgi:hypothetical protein
MHEKPLESDWKTFRKRVPEWRERYLVSRNREIARLLSDESKTPTERFWEAKEQIDKDARLLVDLLDGHSRSKMERYLLAMYGKEFISDADLEEFSDALRERILKFSNFP